MLLCYFRPLHIITRTYARSLTIAPPGGIPDGKAGGIHRNDLRRSARTGTTALERAGRVDVDLNHGLWHFFRRREVDGVIKHDTVEGPETSRRVTGRPWTAAELRRKSFPDLHKLWYVVLRERNLLATQKEEARRIGVRNPLAYTSYSKVFQCRKTMARIKFVLNERRLAYEGALRLLAEKKAEAKLR